MSARWWRRLGYELGRMILVAVVAAGLFVFLWAIVQMIAWDKRGRDGGTRPRPAPTLEVGR